MSLACTGTPKFSGTPFDPPEPVPSLILPQAGGAPFDLQTQQGRVILLFFGYTHCPDICPTTLADWTRVHRTLGADTTRVRFVFVSLDLERDSPTASSAYARNFHPSFIGLSADSTQIPLLSAAFHISSFRDLSPEVRDDTTGTLVDSGSQTYTISHSSQTFVVDPRGQLRLILKYGTPAEAIRQDILTLLEE